MTSTIFRSALASAAFVAWPLHLASAVSVTNASFEDGLLSHPNYSPPGPPNFDGIAPNTAPDGWTDITTSTGAGVCCATTPDWTASDIVQFANNPAGGWASDGTVVLQLDAYNYTGPDPQVDLFQGGVAQTVSGFLPGREYTLEFDVMRFAMAVPPPGLEFDASPLLSILLDGNSAMSLSPTGVFETELNPLGQAVYLDHTWQTVSYSFTATAETHEVGFMVNSSDQANPLLLAQVYVDNVSLVPEPNVAVLGLIGRLGVCARRRRS